MNNEEVKTETQSSNQNFEQQSMIDNQKLTRIVRTIITLENNNVKTRELNDEDMKKKIEKIIEEVKAAASGFGAAAFFEKVVVVFVLDR